MLMFRWMLILVMGWTLAAAGGDTPPPGASPPTGAEETEGEAAGDAEAARETGQDRADAAPEAPPVRLSAWQS